MKIILLLIACLIFQGCATKIVRVTPQNEEDLSGVRFYKPKPYLVVSQDDSTGETKMNFIYLPNYKKEYSIEGSIEDIHLEDGWNLKKLNGMDFNESVDKSILPDNLELLPGVYEFLYCEGKVKGFRKVQLIY